MSESMQKKTSVMAILSLVFGCLLIIPFLGLLFSIAALILGIIALVAVSKEENNLKGKGLAISGIVLGAVGIILVPLMVIITASAIAVPNLIKARVTANDSAAKASVMTIATAIETYATTNNGNYPMFESALLEGSSPFLPRSYDNEVIYGYKYSLELSPDSYKVVANPENCGTTGTKIFEVGTGGMAQERECK